jgi:exopolysaccharide biosynthesis polyprenyl glycosylphosphotransferase
MLTRSSRTFTLWLFIGDMLLTLVALLIARQIRLVLPLGMTLDPLTGSPLVFNINRAFYALVLVVWVAVFVTLPVYDNRRSLHAIGDVQIMLVAIGFAILILAGLAYFFYRDLSRVLFVYFALIDAVLLTVWRGALRFGLRVRHAAWPGSKRRVLIVGGGPLADEVATRLRAYTWTGLELVGFLSNTPGADVLGPLSAAASIVTRERIDEVLIALPLRSQQDMIDLITDLQRHTVSVRVVPDLFDLAFTRAGIDDLDGIPIVSLRDPVLTPVQRIAKRLFDLIVASLLSVIGALPMLLIALAIRRDSPGPAIFCQQRVGERGKLFWMYKFRTMIDRAGDRPPEVNQSQSDGQLLFKRPDDPRLTRVGRWLRQFSLDELPQLWNVLIGDMSLVGPRPELPWLVDQYADWQRKRFNVPQGMTGWWQVTGRSQKPTLAKTRDDLYYIQNYSLLLDILILWKTIGAVVKRTGAF